MSEDGSAGVARRTRGPSTAKTRAALVAAAREVFLEQGYAESADGD
ncbi:MAG: hypothetical protein H0V92_09990 [Pseudonocardiales bacterium]|nr:hypothetical protein [Pseudonocardiales bacterium]